MAQKIKAGEPVSFDAITNKLVEQQANQYRLEKIKRGKTNLELKDLQSFLKKISKDIDNKAYLDMKPTYEGNYKELVGKTTVYNRDAVTMGHILKENRQQCFSGTVLDLTISRKETKGTEYRKDNRVVIMEDGVTFCPERLRKETAKKFYMASK